MFSSREQSHDSNLQEGQGRCHFQSILALLLLWFVSPQVVSMSNYSFTYIEQIKFVIC